MALIAVAVAAAAGPVTAIDAAQIARAGNVAGHPQLTRGQREPADPAQPATDRDAPRQVAVAAPDEADQRRRVGSRAAEHARNPGPARANLCPAPIVRWRETPGRIVHPGPAPGLDQAPLPVAVGRPVRRHGVRVPDGAVGDVAGPLAVAVQRLIADHVARQVARGLRCFVGADARGHPLVEGVDGARAGARRHRQAAPAKADALAGRHLGCHTVFAVHQGPSTGDADARGACIGIDVDAVFTRLLRHQRQVGGVDLQPVAAGAAQLGAQGALVQRQAGALVADLAQLQIGLALHAQGGGAGVQLYPGTRIADQPRTAGQRHPGLGGCPAAGFGARDHAGALQAGDHRHPARRVAPRLGPGGGGAQHASQRQRGDAQPASPAVGQRGRA